MHILLLCFLIFYFLRIQIKRVRYAFAQKQTRNWFPLRNKKNSDLFELVHCDRCGPYRIPSFLGARYFFTLVDDYSCSVWLFLMVEKKETQTHLKNFIAMVERQRQFNRFVKTVRSDNGNEFMCMAPYFHEKGISHETSYV